MKRIILLSVLMMSVIGLRAHIISSVEENGSWVYMYDEKGKKYNSLSASTVGTVKGFSSTFFVSENGNWIYIWNADGKKINSMSKSTVGDVIGVAGDTFTSRNGNWIYTWSKNGKKINSRYKN